MCGGRDQVGVFEGRGDGFGCHQATDMGHIGKHVGLNVSAQLEDTETETKQKIRIQVYIL